MKRWIDRAEMLNYLKISHTTLWRMQKAHFTIGKHYRRKTPASKSYLYDLEACEKTLSRLCATPIEA